jgi:hypothetical protein
MLHSRRSSAINPLMDDSPADDVLAGEPDRWEPSCDMVFMPSGRAWPGRGLMGPPALSGLISRRDSSDMPHSRNLGAGVQDEIDSAG